MKRGFSYRVALLWTLVLVVHFSAVAEDLVAPETSPLPASESVRTVDADEQKKLDRLNRRIAAPRRQAHDAAENAMDVTSSMKKFATVAFAIVVVLALIAAMAVALRKFIPGARPAGGKLPGLEVVGRIPLSPKQFLVLARVGRRLLVIGVGPEGMNTLCTVDEPEEVEQVLFGGGKGDAAGGFRAWMATMTGGRGVSEPPVEKESVTEAFSALRERLGKMKEPGTARGDSSPYGKRETPGVSE